MKQSVLYVLTIGAMFLFGSCDKDYDYRDKWVGEYEYDFFHKTHLQGTGTLTVSKYAQDSVMIIISRMSSYSPPETYDSYYYFQVLENGTIELHKLEFGDCWSGCFKNRNNLELTFYNLYNSNGDYIYKCKKIKK